VVNGSGFLYVANPGRNVIEIFSPHSVGNVSPRVLGGNKSRLLQPQSIAIEGDGTIDVFGGSATASGTTEPDDHYVARFARSATGDVAPLTYTKIMIRCDNLSAP
jgi:hypothetical protein